MTEHLCAACEIHRQTYERIDRVARSIADELYKGGERVELAPPPSSRADVPSSSE